MNEHEEGIEGGAIGVAETTIAAVTVYSDRARVIRRGRCALVGGRQRVAVEPLPHRLDDGSVAASVGGARGVRLLSIEVEPRFGHQVTRDEAAGLLGRRDELRLERQVLEDERERWSEEDAFVSALPLDPETDEHDNARPVPLRPEAWASALAFVGERMGSVRTRLREIARRREALDEQLGEVELALRSQASYESDARKRVVLELAAEVACETDLELTYTLAGPRWRPSYDMHVDAVAGRLELCAHAQVRQSTGEDWTDAELRLSTASPVAGADLPELLAWRLGDTEQLELAADVEELGEMTAQGAVPGAPMASMPAAEMAAPPPMQASQPARKRRARSRAAFAREKNARLEADEEVLLDAVMDEEPSWEVAKEPSAPPPPRHAPAQLAIRRLGSGLWSLPPGAELAFGSHDGGFVWSGTTLSCPSPRHAAGGFDFAHRAEGAQTVPADGQEHRIPLEVQVLACELLHEVVAPLEQRAYLRASAGVGEERPLLAGEAFVFLDGGFVARAFVDTVAPGATLELSLGVDDDLKVERKVEQNTATTGLLSKKDRTVYRVDVSVRSYKDRVLRLRVRDQVPITWQPDDIAIETLQVEPRPDDPAERGMMVWTMDVGAGAEARVQLEYAVERPRDFELSSQREGV